MEVIKLLLTDDDLANITGGITIEKRIKNNEKDIVMSVSYTGGKWTRRIPPEKTTRVETAIFSRSSINREKDAGAVQHLLFFIEEIFI